MGKVKLAPVDGGSSLQATRQLLDELDTLMDRMLSLPINELEESLPPLREVVHAPTLAPRFEIIRRSSADRLEEPEEITQSVRLDVEAPDAGLSPPHVQFEPIESIADLLPKLSEPLPEKLSDPEPLQETIYPPSVVSQIEELLSEEPAPVQLWKLRWLQPLWWCNQKFDSATDSLGRFGDNLQGFAGRMMLGVTGLAMILLSVVWMLRDLLGWTS